MDSLMRSVNRIARLANLYRAEALAPHGLYGGHHTYILNICRNPGVSQEKLAGMIYVNKSNVARQLSYLEENGFVRREQSKTDRRQMLVYPTDKAQQVLPVVRRVLREWENSILEDFAPQEREQLAAVMERVMHKAVSVAGMDAKDGPV